MTRFARDFRLIPIVLLATISLFALKISGLVLDGGYTLGDRLSGAAHSDLTVTTRESIPDVTPIIIADRRAAPAVSSAPKQPWAREMFNFGDVTGSVGASKPADKPKEPAAKPGDKPGAKVEKAPPDPGGTVVAPDPGKLAPTGERAILERLQERRQELDGRARELEMRESLLKATEKRLESRVAELKGVEKRINTTVETRDSVDAQRFKSIVSMYENMKPKDAARIFDRLDMKILVEVATQINPRKMSDILAQMQPDAAERLTVELANRAKAEKSQPNDPLPKIEGKPNAS